MGWQEARREADVIRKELEARMQQEGDRFAEELTQELDLPEGVRVTYELEPLIEQQSD